MATAFSIPVIAANTGVHCNFVPGTLTISPLFLESSTPFQSTDGTTNQGNVVYTFVSYFNFSYSVTQTDEALEYPAMFSLLASFQVTHTAPSVGAFTLQSCRIEILSDDQARGSTYTTVLKNSENNSRSVVQVTGTGIGTSASFGGSLNLKVYFSYVSNASTSNPVSLAGATPTGSVGFVAGSCGYTYLSELNPLYRGLLDSTYGWLPTMNTNLQSMVSMQATTNGYLNSVISQNTTTNNYLSSILGQEQVENSHLTDVKSNQVQQIGQLQQIVDYVNSTVAANAVDDAKTDFGNNAASLESGQAALEDRADTAFDAVDTDTSIIVRYQNSTNFWLRCIAALPSAIGSLWDVIGFALLFAFVLFILKLAR